MPAPIEIIAPTIVRFTMKHTLADGRLMDNVVDVSLDENGTTRHDAVSAIVPKIRDAWQTRTLSVVSNTVTFTGGHYIDLDSLGGISGDFTPNSGISNIGIGSAPALPPAVAYLIIKSCAHNRRQRAGRMYISGADEASVDAGGVLGSTVRTGLNAAFAGLKADILAAGAIFPPATTAWRVVHIAGYDGVVAPGFPLGRPNAWSSSDVTSATADTHVGTQRRRQR